MKQSMTHRKHNRTTRSLEILSALVLEGVLEPIFSQSMQGPKTQLGRRLNFSFATGSEKTPGSPVCPLFLGL